MLSRERGGVLGAAERRVSLTDLRCVFIWGSTARGKEAESREGRKGEKMGRVRGKIGSKGQVMDSGRSSVMERRGNDSVRTQVEGERSDVGR